MKKHPQPLDEMMQQGATNEEAMTALDLFALLRPGLNLKQNKRVYTDSGDKTPLGLYRSIIRVINRHPLKESKRLRRFWINQPSTMQDYHKLHGVNVLANPGTNKICDCYFVSGNLISQRIHKLALSPGWL